MIWEYKIAEQAHSTETFDKDGGSNLTTYGEGEFERRLNALGKEGWELVHVRMNAMGREVWYLKRAKPKKGSEDI